MFSRLQSALIFSILSIFLCIGTAFAQQVVVSQLKLTFEYDPAYATTWEDMQRSGILFDPLVVLDRDNKIIGGAAESWKISEDGRTYRFKLRQGAKWSDGHPVTADDFVLAFRRIVSAELTRAPKPTYLLDNIENASEIDSGEKQPADLGVKAVSSNEFEIRLEEPAAYFLSILLNPALVPVPGHVIDKIGDKWADGSTLVSNGPMKLVKKTDDGFTLIKRPEHWWKLGFDTIKFRHSKDQNNVARDLVSGISDMAVFLRKTQMEWMEAGDRLKIISTPSMASHYGIFNTQIPKLANPEVRRALSLAIDRNAIARAIEFSPGQTFAPLKMWNASNSVIPDQFLQTVEERQDLAKEILRKEGYSDQNPLKIKIDVINAYEHDRMAQGIKSMWAKIGVETQVSVLDTKPFVDRIFNKKFEICLGYWAADYDDPLSFLGVLKKGGPKNFSSWDNPDYNKYLASAYRTPNATERDVLYDQMEHLILKEAPIFSLGHPKIEMIKSGRVKDINFDMSGMVYRSIELED